MKKTKTLTVLAVIGAVLVGIGLVISVIGLAIGGVPRITSFGWNKNGWFWGEEIQYKGGSYWTQVEDLSGDTEEAITAVELRIAAAAVEIVIAEQGGYEILDYPKDELTVTNQNGTLRIIDRDFDSILRNVDWNTNTSPRVTVYVTQAELDSLTLVVGAGTVHIADLQVQSLRIEAGACEARLRNVSAEACEISQGAGRIDSERCTFNNLTIESGAGEFDFSGTLTGNCSIEGGVGSVELTLTGSLDDYYFRCSQGVGAVRVEGASHVGGIGATFNVGNSGAATVITVEAGVGEIDVEFAA